MLTCDTAAADARSAANVMQNCTEAALFIITDDTKVSESRPTICRRVAFDCERSRQREWACAIKSKEVPLGAVSGLLAVAGSFSISDSPLMTHLRNSDSQLQCPKHHMTYEFMTFSIMLASYVQRPYAPKPSENKPLPQFLQGKHSTENRSQSQSRSGWARVLHALLRLRSACLMRDIFSGG
jgi:hypothetical protein